MTALVVIVLLVSAAAGSDRWFLRALLLALVSTGSRPQLAGISIPLDLMVGPIALFAVYMRGRVPGERRRGAELLLAAWLAVALFVSWFESPEFVRSLFIVVQFAVGVVAFGVMRSLSSEWRSMVAREFCWAGAWVAVITIAAWVVSYVTGNLNDLVVLNFGETTPRAIGTSFEPNLLGSALIAIAGLGYAFKEEIGVRYAFVTGIAMTAAACLTLTRTTWVAALLLAAAWLGTARRHVAGVALLPAVGVFSVGVAWFAWTTVSGVLNDLGARSSGLFDFSSGTGGYRRLSYEVAVDQIRQNDAWLLGLGVNSFPQRNSSDLASDGEFFLSNFWLSLLYDTGLVGAVLFVLAVAVSVGQMGRRLNAAPALVGIALAAVTTNPLWFALPWIVVGLLLPAGFVKTPVVDPRDQLVGE